MDAKGFHIRDKIDLTQTLIDKQLPLAVDQLPFDANFQAPPGAILSESTLTFIAREIVSPGGGFLPLLVMQGYDLVLIAETLHLRDLLIVAPVGAYTDPPLAAIDGEEGAGGPNITIICKNLYGVSARSEGGKGGRGLPYTDGEGEGTEGLEECFFGQDGHPHCLLSIPPGKGKRGKPGMKGGAGGAIVLKYVNDFTSGGFDPTSLSSSGGAGGGGGPGGLGGRLMRQPPSHPGDPIPDLFFTGRRGDEGDEGATGLVGDASSTGPQRINETQYLVEVRSHLRNLFDEQGVSYQQRWANHRLQMAEFVLRTYNPAQPQHAGNLPLALAEAGAVLQLDADNERATQLQSFIGKNLNILGQERDFALKPDFEQFYSTLFDYESPIRDMFLKVSDLLEKNLIIDSIGDVLSGQLGELEIQKARLEDEQEDASQRVEDVKDEQIALHQSISNVASEVNRLELEIAIGVGKPTGLSFVDNLVPIFAGVVIPVLANVAVPGSGVIVGAVTNSLLAYGPDLVGNPQVVKDFDTNLNTILANTGELQEKIGALTKDAKGVENYMKEYETLLQNSPDPSAALNSLQTKLKTDWGDTVNPIAGSFTKIINGMKNAQITGGNNPVKQNELLQRYQELASLQHQQMQAKLREQQAELALERSNTYVSLAEDQRDNLLSDIDKNNQNQLQIRNAALNLLRAAQAAQTLQLQYDFWAARALQLYTLSAVGEIPYLDLSDNAGLVKYDYGFANPDVEAEFLEESVTQGATFRLAGAILESIAVIQSQRYRAAYDSYLKDHGGYIYTGGIHTVTLSAGQNPTLLQQLKTSRKTTLIVNLEDLKNKNVYDTKVTGFGLQGKGLTSQVPFSLKVTHGGHSVQRRLADKQEVKQLYSRGNELINVVSSGAAIHTGRLGVDEFGNAVGAKPNWWGRGVAAEWTLAVEDQSVDLSNLEELAVHFFYSAFLDESVVASSLHSIVHSANAVQPGATVPARVTLLRPAPAGGMAVQLKSSDAALVKVPGVVVPAGETTATVPMQIAAGAAGKSVTMTATGDYALETQLRIPSSTARSFAIKTQPGFEVTVNALATDGEYTYACLGYSALEDGPEAPVGDLVAIHLQSGKMTHIAVGFQPRSVAVNRVTRKIYVVNGGQKSYSLSVIQRTISKAGDSFKVTKTLDLKPGPTDVEVNSKTNRVYVTNWFQRKLHVIDGASDTELASIHVGDGPQRFAVDDATNRLYLARSYRSSPDPKEHINALTVIQGHTNGAHTVQEPIAIGEIGTQSINVAINANPEVNRIYIGNLGSGDDAPSVIVLNRADLTPVGEPIRTNAGCRAIAANPVLNQVYVATDSGVQIIDCLSNEIRSTFLVNFKRVPSGIAVNPATGRIYAEDAQEGLVKEYGMEDLSTLTHWR